MQENMTAEEIAIQELEAIHKGAMNEDVLNETTEPVEEIVASEEVEITEVLTDELLKDIEAEAARAETYAAQKAESLEDVETTKTTIAKGKSKGKTSTVVSGTAPARPAPRDLNAVDEQFFQLSIKGAKTDKAAVIAKRPAQVKIAEKFDNLFTSISVGRKPSTYVMQALDVLLTKKVATSADFIAGFKAAGLGDGTARSQTGQIMELFRVVGMAERSGQTLTLNADSKIVERLVAINTGAVAASPAPATT